MKWNLVLYFHQIFQQYGHYIQKNNKLCDLWQRYEELLLSYSPDGSTVLWSQLVAVKNVLLNHTNMVKKWCFNTLFC